MQAQVASASCGSFVFCVACGVQWWARSVALTPRVCECVPRCHACAWVGRVPDPFCSNTELEGGSTSEAVSYLSGVLRELANDGSVLPPHAGLAQHVTAVCDMLAAGVAMMRCGLEQQLRNLRTALSGLVHGGCVVIPAGWLQRDGGHAIMLVRRRRVCSVGAAFA